MQRLAGRLLTYLSVEIAEKFVPLRPRKCSIHPSPLVSHNSVDGGRVYYRLPRDGDISSLAHSPIEITPIIGVSSITLILSKAWFVARYVDRRFDSSCFRAQKQPRVAQVGSRFLLFGGADAFQQHFADTHSFDAKSGKWEKVRPLRTEIGRYGKHGARCILMPNFGGGRSCFGLCLVSQETGGTLHVVV